MVKNVFCRMKKYPVALAIIGWLSFGLGVLVVEPLWLKLALLSAARVLP
jgi:hypothetical protein